jgi:hypothetical protein
MSATTTRKARDTDDRVMRWQWRRHPRCVGLARSQMRKALARWGLAGIEGRAVLVVSELVTNAVVHARVRGREVATRFVRLDGGVRIEVQTPPTSGPCRGCLITMAASGCTWLSRWPTSGAWRSV